MSASRLTRLRHHVMVAGLVAGIIALGVPWVSVSLTTGADGVATWADFSPASFSLALAAAAGWGATLLTRPLATRVLSAVQSGLAVSALLFVVSSIGQVGEVATRTAAAITGVSGVFGASDITWAWNHWGVGLSVVTCGAFFLSGVAGMVYPGEKRRRPSRYEQPGGAGDAHPWDALSDGTDPTAR